MAGKLCDVLFHYVRFSFWLFQLPIISLLATFRNATYNTNTICSSHSLLFFWFLIRSRFFLHRKIERIKKFAIASLFYNVREWFILLSVNVDFILLHLSLFTSIKCWLYLLHCYLVFIMVVFFFKTAFDRFDGFYYWVLSDAFAALMSAATSWILSDLLFLRF